MRFTTTRIDVQAYQPGADPPHDIIQRQPGQLWLVPHSPITLTSPVDWKHTRRKDYVYVPLHPYITPAEPDLALGFMLQLGLRVSFDVGRAVERLHLAIGHPVNEMQQPGTGVVWQYQVGMALLVS